MATNNFRKIENMDNSLSKIGVGVLGYGFMGRTHSNAYLKIPFLNSDSNIQPELIALCGRNEEIVKEYAAKLKYRGYYTNWKDLVNDSSIQIFDNCSPDNFHPEPTIEAAKKGKHVLCEKPLAMTVSEAKKMLDAVTEAGVKNMCCYNYRFIPAVRLAKNIIKKGLIGDIYNFRGKYMQQIGYNPDETIENVWYASGTNSGILLGIGSHIIDMAGFLVGDITTTQSIVKTFTKERRNNKGEMVPVTSDEENISIVGFEGGAVGTLESSGISAGRNNQLSWEIYGTRGSMSFDLENPNYLQVCLPEKSVDNIVGFSNVSVTGFNYDLYSLILPPGHNAGWEYGHVHALNHFVDCVVNDKPVSPYAASFTDAYKTQVIMQAIQDSSESGRRLNIQY